jgi:hypothetical protein
MPFDARCPYCRLKVKKVPDQRLGGNMECVRCHNRFMLEPMEGSPPAATPGGQAPMTVASLVKEIPAETQASAQPIAAAPAVERLPPNYLGLASFVLACFGVLGGTLSHNSMLALGLGLAALVLGIVGVVSPVPTNSRRILPIAGLLVSVPAVVVAALLPQWGGMSPLWTRSRPAEASREAAIALYASRGAPRGARSAAKGETLWVDASKDALLHQDIRLRLRSAVVGPGDFEPLAGQKPPAETCLVIGLRITNAGISRKVSYKGWGEPALGLARPVLRDDNGKSYAEKSFARGWQIKGRSAAATLAPGKSIDDVLVFEAPPQSVEYLRLELPGWAVSTGGSLRLQIPRDKVLFR